MEAVLPWLTWGANYMGTREVTDIVNAHQSVQARLLRAFEAVIEMVPDWEVQRWRGSSGLSSVGLLVAPSADAEPQVAPEPTLSRPGQPWFEVRCNWFRPEFLDKVTGPWRLVAVITSVLALIADEEHLALPTLPRPKFSEG